MNSNEAGGIRRIVVVDDDRRVRDLLARYLGDAGFDAHAVEGGRALFESLEVNRADLVVLDILLSQEDGIDICRRLHNSPQRVPVLMLSAAAATISVWRPFPPARTISSKVVQSARIAGTHSRDIAAHSFHAVRPAAGTQQYRALRSLSIRR